MLNREAVFARIDAEIARNGDDATLGLLLVRLQRVHELNVLFGYALREELEDALLAHFRSVLRPVDVPIPIGTGEWLVLLPGLVAPNHALLAAHRLVRALEQPLITASGPVQARIAIGASAYPKHAEGADALCRRAETAYAEALRRSERVALYRPGNEFTEISYHELRDALREGQLQVHVQPIRDLRRRQLSGIESLARWQSPRWGWVNPYLFVQLAEQTGLITELWRWSLNASLRLAAEARLPERGLRLSLNLSPRLFSDEGLPEQVVAALKLWGLPPASLVLEVTEGAVMDDPERSVAMLGQLATAGVHIAIDDFGIGQASFAYLHQLPARELKIDQSFVLDLQRNPRSARLVSSMIELAHHVGLAVVAEGVADAETERTLTGMGCDFAQGFHIGRPAPVEEWLPQLPVPRASRGNAPVS